MENQETKICPKCGGNMIKGKIIDESYMVAGTQKWTTAPAMLAMLGLGRKTRKVITYACEKCKFLESYLA